jgi:hypothetical protein
VIFLPDLSLWLGALDREHRSNDVSRRSFAKN